MHPSKVAVVNDITELSAFAASEGITVSQSDTDALSPLQAGASFLALAYDKTSERVRSETLRLTLPSAAPAIPFGIARESEPVSVLLYTVAPGRAHVDGGEELEPDQVATTWKVVDGESDYSSQRDKLLGDKQGLAWLVEASGEAPLYQWLLLPGQSGSIAPAVHAYFTQAKAAGATTTAVAECLTPLWDAKDAGALGGVVLPYCAPGLLASVPSATPPEPCNTTPGAGEIAADPLVCDNADDVAAALGGLNPAEAKLTRQVGVIAAQTPGASSVSFGNGLAVSPLRNADEADTTGCVTGSGGSSGNPGTGGSGGYGGNGGGIGGPGEYPPTGPDYGEQPADTNVDVGVSCTGSSEGSGCSGDSSDSSSSDGCSGDSSDSSSSSDGCSGDSSDSSDSCSGDSSSSSSGDGCSGDSSSGGEGCSGDSGSSSGCSGSGSSGDGCTIIHGRRRPHVSALFFGLVALLLPLRRIGARRRRARS